MKECIDTECLDCRHYRAGKCNTWCENGECWTPLNKAGYIKIVHGKWIGRVNMFDGNLYYNCSVCGCSNPYNSDLGMFPNYCPECGAKMDL